MTSVNISLDEFPRVDPAKKTEWAPILCKPKDASWEILVVGIVAVDRDGFHIEVANKLSRLGCLYDAKAMPITLAIEIAVGWLEEVLTSGISNLSEISFPVNNVSLGSCQAVRGLGCEEVARQWIGSLSSFHKASNEIDSLEVGQVLKIAKQAIETRKLRLPVQVLGIIEKRDISLLEYFHEDVRNRSSRRARANARVKIDYDGRRLSANIDKFNVDSPSGTVGTLKQRLWDLATQRDRYAQSAKAPKAFEMLVEFPKHRILDKRPKSVERIQEHLKELTEQADSKEIMLRTLSGAEEIGEHILAKESV